MINENISYKLVNVCLIGIVLFLIIKTGDFWIRVVEILKEICFPFFLAFILSYAFYPIFKNLNKLFPKVISILIFMICASVFVCLFFITLLPLILNSFGPFLENTIYFFKEISFKYSINFDFVFNFINTLYEDFLSNNKEYLAHGIIEIASFSVGFITNLFIFLFSYVYLLYNMDNIKMNLKKQLNKKTYIYFKQLDDELNNYLIGFWSIMFITFFEYFLVYFIIGHPNYLILALISVFLNLIPYFGGIIVGIIAVIMAFSVGPHLVLKTIIVWFLFSIIDSYVINPLVYKKQNNLSPIIIVFSVAFCSKIGGFLGVILSVPFSIIVIHTLKHLKKHNFVKKT